MGNQLVAFAPSLIRPIEHYLTDISEHTFDINLGSTRFLKVCRTKHHQLLCVVKVFVIHEHTIPIPIYCERLISLRNSLLSSPSPNCLPFTNIKLTERSVIVIRPYIKYSLYDRMSTRPFIQWPEKLWIAFQLLYALAQVHRHGLSHGDLKLENILITPGLRLLICDFAPFKPVYLPRNNPSAIFGFFFDTAGRRCCYVAPERFHDDKSRLGADNLLTQEDELKHFLLPSMDIFSAGCCLIELFTEGQVPFDLSQLLSFCNKEYDPTPIINRIEDENARELVSHMIQSDSAMRSTAEEYLLKYRSRLFPEILYSTLQSYFDILAFQPLSKPDSRMARLHSDIKNLPNDPSLSLIFTSLVTAEVRGLTTVTAKLYILDSFRILSLKLTEEAILERIVPYIVHLIQDPSSPRIRSQALDTLVECLDVVKNVPPSDYNIFTGYIFPALENLDRDVAVRIALAKNIARIAQISLRYLEASFLHDPEHMNIQQPQFVSELHSQRESIASFLSQTLTYPDSVVKRVLVSTPGSLETLCTYFGRSKAHDIILSHLITFLNDKEDAELRQAFFRCVPAVASFIGWHAAPLLIPLLKQGLTDVEEFVMRESLLTIKSLAEINFFGRRFLFDLLEEVLPFCIHPNLWLRNACVGVLTSFRKNLSQVDIHCHVIPKLKVYLKHSSNTIWGVNEFSILSKVRPPLERQVYESCARGKDTLLHSTIEFLKINDGKGAPDSNEVNNFIIRLHAEGLPHPTDPVYTAFINKHITKVNTQRSLRTTAATFTRGGSTITQQQFQSHLLTLSSLPIKDISYNNNFSNSFGSENSLGGNFAQITSTGLNLTPPAHFNERPKGILVAHLHEHRGAITRVTPLASYKGIFASSTREDIRVWDAEKMEGKNVANRSRCIIRLPGEKNITHMTNGAGSNLLGVTDQTELSAFVLENMTATRIFTTSIKTNLREDIGMPIALESYSPNLFLIGTELGMLIGFDTRIPTKEIIRLHSDLKWGLLTSLTSDGDRNWMCTGSTKGVLTCWDLRFNIPVNTLKTDWPIRKVKASPFHTWGVFSTSRGPNESSLWNLETGNRELCLWASTMPPLTRPSSPGDPIPAPVHGPQYSMFGMTFVKSMNALITGGSDQSIRWWDLNSHSDSYLLSYPEKAELQINSGCGGGGGGGGSPNTMSGKSGEFRFRLVDGIEVIHDITNPHPGLTGKTSDITHSPGSTHNVSQHTGTMGNAHHNTISDVTTISTPNQSFIISSSTDGVIKVWK